MIKLSQALVAMGIVIIIHSSTAKASTPCQHSVLLNEHRDVATIESLELEWTRAFLRGDTGFEECLLTADFTEIMLNGDIKHLSDELALAAKNKAKPLPLGELPKGTVLLHGSVAVAYGRSQSGTSPQGLRYADYYVWENGKWCVFFAHQTEIATNH
jgi:hypothetical protein